MSLILRDLLENSALDWQSANQAIKSVTSANAKDKPENYDRWKKSSWQVFQIALTGVQIFANLVNKKPAKSDNEGIE